jgi:hypothetical protein
MAKSSTHHIRVNGKTYTFALVPKGKDTFQVYASGVDPFIVSGEVEAKSILRQVYSNWGKH